MIEEERIMRESVIVSFFSPFIILRKNLSLTGLFTTAVPILKNAVFCQIRAIG
jgi:hypothetical protein